MEDGKGCGEDVGGSGRQRMQCQKLEEQWDSPAMIERGKQWHPRSYHPHLFSN